MYGERYGVTVYYPGGGMIVDRTEWFFTLEEAREFATRSDTGTIVKGVLHNDEGCTPWIEKRKRRRKNS